MLTFERRHAGGELGVSFALAVLLHALFIAFVLPTLLAPPEDLDLTRAEPKAPADAEQEMRVTMRVVDIEEPVEQPPEPPEELEIEEPEPEEPPEEVVEPDDTLQRKTVQQVTNEERPTEADYVSDQDNKVDEQTRATETTLDEVIPSDEPPPEETADAGAPDPTDERSEVEEDPTPQEVAMNVPTPRERRPAQPPPEEQTTPEQEQAEAEVEPEQARPTSEDGARPDVVTPESPVVRKKPREESSPKQVDPRKLFGPPSVADYERVFGDDPPEVKAPGKKRRRMFSNFAARKKALRGSLENMIPEIKPGNHTAVNAHRSVYAGYIGAMHRRIHRRWAHEFLTMIDTRYPMSHPLQDPTLSTKLEFVIDAESGEFDAVNIVESSGELLFDAEAVDTAWSIGRRPNPPPPIISPNGKVYIHWTFWRDGRQCGVFGVSVLLLQAGRDGVTRKVRTTRPD